MIILFFDLRAPGSPVAQTLLHVRIGLDHKPRLLTMPFKSAKQRRFLYAKKPAIAKRWTKKYGSKIKK